MRPRLSPYRRYELRKGLQEAAKARGETVTKEVADYCIDKASRPAARFGRRLELHRTRKPRGNYCGNPAEGAPRRGGRPTNLAVRGIKLRRGSRIFWTVALVAIAYLIARALVRIGCSRSGRKPRTLGATLAFFLRDRSSRFSRAENPSPAYPGVKRKTAANTRDGAVKPARMVHR